jgi:DNA-binding GntR family transcriptional regulator
MTALGAREDERAADHDLPRTRTTVGDIVKGVMNLIALRRLQPGDRVREQDLADRFGVSRGPVREAMRILQAKAILKFEPMRGATIARMSDVEAVDAIEMSAVLFGLAAKRAAERASDAEKAAITAAAAKLFDMVADEAPKEFFTETLRVGRRVLEAAHSERLAALVVDVRFGAPDLFGPLGFTTRALRKKAAEKWSRLARAVQDGDGATAERMGIAVHTDAMAAGTKIAF